jgi:putative DNA primase/helicase
MPTLNDFEEQVRHADRQSTWQPTTLPIEDIESELIVQALDRNTDGDASLFVDLHRDRFVYDCSAGRWYTWAGHHWSDDLTGESVQAVTNVVEVYETEVKRQVLLRMNAAKDMDREAEAVHRNLENSLVKRIRLLQTLPRKQDVLVLARSGRGTLGIAGNEWDRDPWALVVSNGVIDLKTGELSPGIPTEFHKTATSTAWRGIDDACPAWERFIADIFGENGELASFVQRLLGYGLTGLSILHVFPILYGIGRNGKGTLLETLRYVLGDYAMKTESELLLEQKYSRQAGSPNSGVLSLRGRRIVWASETSDGRRLNSGKVKELVGGDTLNARAVFGRNHVQFEPSHMLLLLTNAKPSAPASDYALWKRIYLIPFTQSFVDDPKTPNERMADPYLGDTLKAEASGILAWLVRGCLAWQREGLNPPAIVRAATEDYRQDEDTIGRFIDERLVQGKNHSAKAGAAYKAFKGWCEEVGMHPASGKRFGAEMKARFDSFKDEDGIHYLGIGILAE